MRALTLSLIAAMAATAVLAGSPSRATPGHETSTAADRSDKRVPVNARDALGRVEDIFSTSAGSRRGDHRHDGRGLDATLALRDLALTKHTLPSRERRRAERYLARPTDGDDPDGYQLGTPVTTDCSTGEFCLHYVTTTADASGVAFANKVEEALLTTHVTYQNMGYREPRPDAGQGGSTLPDIYLADIGPGLFGYCAGEDWANPGDPGDFTVYGYCVLDNDYAASEFGNSQTPVGFMRATAAHEYFHAVQYSYDAFDDDWFLEATATWAEDEVFDNVNDNVVFLYGPRGPMTNPRVSMDHPGGSWYGYWVFYRYLSQKYGARVVRAMWNRADTVGNAPDQFSLQATRSTVAARGGSWNNLWRRFADANRRPRLAYQEARTGEATYPSSRPRARYTLSPKRRSRAPSVSLDHLTSAVYRFAPNRKMKQQRGWRLKVKIDGDAPGRGGSGLATIMSRSGKISRVAFDLDNRGIRTKKLAFGRDARWVEVTVVNASTRFANCWSDLDGFAYSCLGVPRDQNRNYRVAVTAMRR